MIEIILKDTEGNCISKATGDIIFFAAVNVDKVHSQIRGSGTTIELMQLYTALKDTAKDLESDNPIIKIFECFCETKRTKYDLSPIEEMKKGED